jgi:hypothetical protein
MFVALVSTELRKPSISVDEEPSPCVPANLLLSSLAFVHKAWVRSTGLLRVATSKFVIAIATHAATYPILWIIVVLALSISVAYTGVKNDFKLELDVMKLFTPITSNANEHRYWHFYDSGLPAVSTPYIPMQIILHRDGKNVVEYDGVKRVFEVLDLATSLDGFHQICVDNSSAILVFDKIESCDVHGVSRYWNHSKAIFDKQVSETDDITTFMTNTTYMDGTIVDFDKTFGRLELDDDGVPVSAEALFLELVLPLSRIGSRSRYDQYESNLISAVADLRHLWVEEPGNDYRVEFSVPFNLPEELKDGVFADVPLVPFVIAVMVLFTCSVFWKCHRVKSRFLLALGAVLTVLLALATGFGLLFHLGKFNL